MAYLKQITKGDFDCLLMLFFDNFSSLLGILAGMLTAPMIATDFEGGTYGAYYGAFGDMVWEKVCPGIGCALLFGQWPGAVRKRVENDISCTLGEEGSKQDINQLVINGSRRHFGSSYFVRRQTSSLFCSILGAGTMSGSYGLD